MPDALVRIEDAGDGSAVLSWPDEFDPDVLVASVRAVADEALGRGLRRLEIQVPAIDAFSRRAAVRAGFRYEGTRREVLARPDGWFGDLALFGRLAGDEVSGPTGFSGVMNSALPRKRLIAHVLMRDGDGRILLCDTQFKTDWELPGGIVEPGEPPRIGAEREVLEELGINLVVGRLLVADWMPPYLGWDDAVELIFDGGTVTAAELEHYVLQASEIKRIRLCTLAEAAELVTPLSHRRLTIAAGLQPTATVYLEDGVVPGG